MELLASFRTFVDKHKQHKFINKVIKQNNILAFLASAYSNEY